MPHKIALIYTTFIRPYLARKTLDAILGNPHLDTFDHIIAGDQIAHAALWCDLSPFSAPHYPKTIFYNLPFDCGLSFARNYLVKKADALGCDYCVLSADSIMFADSSFLSLPEIVDFLDADPRRAIVGFELKGRVSWEHNMEMKDGTFVLTPSTKLIAHKGIAYVECDICRNFFVAKTSVLRLVQWDDGLKLCEHEDFFWRVKQAGYQVFYTEAISADYIRDRPTDYDRYRNRLYGEFKDKLMKKYNLTKWFKVVR